jgi:hypothetical protein
MFKRRVFMRPLVRCPLLDGGAPLFDGWDFRCVRRVLCYSSQKSEDFGGVAD